MAFRRSKNAGSAPAWASPLTSAQLLEFYSTLLRELQQFGVEIGDGFVTVAGRSTHYGLTNLAQQWVIASPRQRNRVVQEHFKRLFDAEDAPRPEGADLLALLRPRLWSRETVASAGVPLLTRDVADDLVAVLCVDLPTTVVTLKPEQGAATGKSVDELWDIATDQIDDGQAVADDRLEDGTRALTGDSPFVASRLLELDRFVGPLATHGAVVAVPHRHMLLVYELPSLDVVLRLNYLIVAATNIYRKGPGSISPSVYWWRPSEPLVRIPASADGASVTVTPSAEFLEALNALPSGRLSQGVDE